jgi:hypothetical protein
MSPQEGDPGEPPIELEPIDLKRLIPPADADPVPGKPLHLCPNCDYILTGLVERRCPECGEPFTLSDARWHARERSSSWLERVWVTEVPGRLLFVAAAVIFLVAVGISVAFSRKSGIKSTGMFLQMLLMVVLTGAFFLRMGRNFPWGLALVTSSIVYLVLSVVLTFAM